MRREFWNLWIWEDDELEARLGGRLRARETLHHWPLSWVEKLTLEDGRALVYKSQCAAASVEKAVYETVRAPFLLAPVWAETCGGCDMLVLPYCPLPPVGRLSPPALARLAEACSQRMQGLALPAFFDLSTPERLAALMQDACRGLLREGEASAARDALRRWLETRVPALYAGQQVGDVHGDLSVSNLLREGETVRYILDWQRPLRAPLALERALALRLAEYDAGGDWDRLARAVHLLWFAWAYGQVLPIEGVRQTALRLLEGFAGEA